MPKYDITVTFNIETEVEADLYRHSWDDSGTVDGVNDESYFSSVSVTADGGSLSFSVEAEDEDDAEQKAIEIIAEGNEVEDSNGLTWLVSNTSYNVELVEEPMDLPKAIEMVTAYLMDQELPDELKEAFRFILARIA